ncbi:MAG TPA: septal ring lytic transglycosylase RlpA family protein [Candidatus Angelobacter sp.]|jgi:rare lipoprotein A|nr:septal ring lytic transglycosylase RlpA family protein [Candidatus Angelobacter sp.]
MNRLLSILAAALCLVANVGAAPVPNHQQPQAKTNAIPVAAKTPKTQSVKNEPKPFQVGSASWYGKQFHGKTTASGEDFDMFEFTAAHRTLPLGTFVKVTNLKNGKWIVVRVNDRGPYVGNRIMDLSYSAARMLNFRDGVERVRIDLIQPEHMASNQGYSAQ